MEIEDVKYVDKSDKRYDEKDLPNIELTSLEENGCLKTRKYNLYIFRKSGKTACILYTQHVEDL